jgi:hypothetical protein
MRPELDKEGAHKPFKSLEVNGTNLDESYTGRNI